MKNVILEEIENMKYLLGYKRGVIISEQQQTTYGNEYITGANPSVNPAQIPSLGTIQPSNQSPADMLKNAQAAAAGLTNTNNQPQTPSPAAATGTQATGAQATGAQATGTQAGTTTTSAPAASTTTTSAPAASTTTTTSAPAASTTTSAPAAATPVTPIKIGVEYPSIKVLQNSLNTKNQAGLKEDSKYGPLTAASVLAALQKLPVNSTETKTPDTNNTNQSAETLKKTAEANASTNGVVNNDQNKNTQQPAGGTNVPEEDGNEFV